MSKVIEFVLCTMFLLVCMAFGWLICVTGLGLLGVL